MEGSTSYRLNDNNDQIARTVVEIAKELGCSPAQLALKWVWDNGVIPIIGARTIDQLKDNIACLDVNIPEGAHKRLNEGKRYSTRIST